MHPAPLKSRPYGAIQIRLLLLLLLLYELNKGEPAEPSGAVFGGAEFLADSGRIQPPPMSDNVQCCRVW